MTNTIELTIPFDGFYETLHSSEIDDNIKQYFDYEGTGDFPEVDGIDFSDVYWDFPYKEAEKQYSDCYTDFIADQAELKTLTYDTMTSPKEYNFETDRIFARMDAKEAMQMLSDTPEDILQDIIEQKFTSRSGFISFYPNNLKEWGKPDTWDHNQWGTVLEAYLYHKTLTPTNEYLWSDYPDYIEYIDTFAIVSDLMPEKWVDIGNKIYEQRKEA